MNKNNNTYLFITAKTESASSLISNRQSVTSVTIKLVKIQHGKHTPRSKVHKKAFYKVFSPSAFKLKPMESINLDLQFNIKPAEGLQITDLNLFPTLTQFGLSIEESNWKTAAQTETINVCLLNKNYSNAFNIKKGQLLIYLMLPYTNKKIITQYEHNESFDEN